MSGPVEPELIRELPTPELALVLLRSLAQGSREINSNNLFRSTEQVYGNERDCGRLLDRLSDAWAWLEARGLIGPNPRQSSGWSRITSDGLAMAEDGNAIAKLWAADRLAGHLDEALAGARTVFNLGQYDTACFAAMKAVEVAVREASGLGHNLTGTALMQQAFRPEGGPLADPKALNSERVATMNLFAGAFGALRNPVGHRTVHYEDPVEAAEVIQLASLLLRIVRRAQTQQP